MYRRICIILLVMLSILTLTSCQSGNSYQSLPAGPYANDGLCDGTFLGTVYESGQFSAEISGTQITVTHTYAESGFLYSVKNYTYLSGTAKQNSDKTVSVVFDKFEGKLELSGLASGFMRGEAEKELERSYQIEEITEAEYTATKKLYEGEQTEITAEMARYSAITMQIDSAKKCFLVTEIETEFGQKETFTYYESGNVRSSTYYIDGDDPRTTYYQENGDLYEGSIEKHDAQGRLTGVEVYEYGHLISQYTFEHDAAGNVVRGRFTPHNNYGYDTILIEYHSFPSFEKAVIKSMAYSRSGEVSQYDEFDVNNNLVADAFICNDYYGDGKNYWFYKKYDTSEREIGASIYDTEKTLLATCSEYEYDSESQVTKRTFYAPDGRILQIREADRDADNYYGENDTLITTYHYIGTTLRYYSVWNLLTQETVYYHPDGTPYGEDEYPESTEKRENTYYDNGQLEWEYIYGEGFLCKMRLYRKDGTLEQESIKYEDGTVYFKGFFPNGNVEYEDTAKNDVTLHSINYYSTGGKEYETVLKDDGLRYQYHYEKSGKLSTVYCNKNDVTQWEEYYSDGKLYEKHVNTKFDQEGEVTEYTYYTYYPNGQVETTGKMVAHHREEGRYVYYSEGGVSYYENGKKSSERFYEGDVEKYISYNEDGTVECIHLSRNDETFESIEYEYYDNGKLKTETFYTITHDEDSTSYSPYAGKEYYESGTLYVEWIEQDGRETRKQYHKNGKLALLDICEYDPVDGCYYLISHVQYDENGNVIHEE